MGGEIQRSSLTHDTGYSATALRTGKFANKHRVSTVCVTVSTRTINKGGIVKKSHNSASSFPKVLETHTQHPKILESNTQQQKRPNLRQHKNTQFHDKAEANFD
jgi:hypothetical protein